MRPLRVLIIGATLASLALAGCADPAAGPNQTFEQRSAYFFNKPETKAALQAVTTIGLEVGATAIEQYANTGKLNGAAIAAGALNGSASLLRSYEGTPQASNPVAITAAINAGAGVPTVARAITAPVVIDTGPKQTLASAVVSAINAGVAPDVAVEVAARSLDQAAADQASGSVP
jgi:hypothetical protein